MYKLLTANHIHELYRYRDLILRLAWSDFKLRYKSSALGFFWSLLEPLLMLVVLYVVFSNLMRIQVEHYQLFLLLGIILWNFLDRGTSMSIWGIVGKPSLVQKVYFPRDILVISTCITALMMTALEFVVFIIFMVDLQSPAGMDCSLLPDSIRIRISDNPGIIHGLVRPQCLLQRRAVHLEAYSPGGILCHANYISHNHIS